MKPVRTQLKRLLKASLLTPTIALFPLVGLAIEVKDVPNPRRINGTWVTDMAGLLDQSTEAQLNSVISQLDRKKGTEIAVVTVPETAPSASPKEFTTALFNYWGIGKKGKDNGVLLLISKGDRRVAIETGYGMKAILPDAKVGNIINTQITPRFKQGDFKGGTLAGTKALVVAIEKSQSSSASQNPIPTAIATSTPQTTLAAQPSALEQKPTQDTNELRVLLIGMAAIGGGLGLATVTCIVVIAGSIFIIFLILRSILQTLGLTSRKISSTNSSHPYRRSSSCDCSSSSISYSDYSSDTITYSNCNSYESDREYNYELSDCSNYESDSSWNSDTSSCSNDDSDSSWNSDGSDNSWSSDNSNYDSDSSWSSDSSDSSWSSDSSSYDSSSSSDYGGGSSDGGGADGSW
jgi:uncharacterized protein